MYASPIVSTCQIQSVCSLNASQCPATYVAVKVTLLAFAADRRAAAVDMASRAAAPPATAADKGGGGAGGPAPPPNGRAKKNWFIRVSILRLNYTSCAIKLTYEHH